MRKNVLSVLATCLAAIAMASVANAQILYDNGPPDGVNGYSNATDVPFGFFRYLLDDFVVPDGETWSITDFHWQHVWATAPNGIGPGTGLLMEFWNDNGNCTPVPGAIATANVTNYSEVNTGNVLFSRNVKESTVEFDKISLPAGHYWFHATIVGPENNFWLTAPVNNCECWVDYADFSGLISGTTQFGVASDLAWQITGTVETGGGCAPPTSYTVFRGIQLSGDLASFADADGNVATFNPGFTINNQEAPVWLVFNANAPNATEVSVTSTAGTPGITVSAECLNWSTGLYVPVGTPEDETFNVQTKHSFGPIDPACIDGNGNVQWRIGWRKTGFTINFPWLISVDATAACD